MNLASAFAAAAQRNAHKTALFWGEAAFSYGQFLAQALGVAEKLQKDLGVRAGDRVGVWLKNCPQFVPTLFGIWQAGAVAVPINNFLKPDEIGFILTDAGINLVITDETMAESSAKLRERNSRLNFFQIENFSSDTSENPQSTIHNPQSSESDLAVIIYTSGTTGRPKGAMLSHGNLLHNFKSCRIVLEAAGEDRIVILLPMFHSFMLTVGIILPMLVGGTIVLIKSVNQPKTIVQEIVRHRATILPAVPQFFRTFTHLVSPAGSGETPAGLSLADLPLRLCISGGAPLPAEIFREFTEKFPIPLLEGYGLSEASPVVSFNPIRGPWKAGSIGLPVNDVEVSVQNEAGKLLPTGETGEICVRGGNVMRGYWNQPEETAKTLRDGWLLTGDIGHHDSDGYFFITDRKKDMLLVNGINVYPREIEEILYQFPGVKEAAVIGVADARKGEQPLAFVAAKDGAALEEKLLLQFLRERLADYKVPRRIVFLSALPRNATGKILKTELRQQAG